MPTQAQDLVIPDSVLKIQDLNTAEIGFVIPLKAGKYLYNLHTRIVPQQDSLIDVLTDQSELQDSLITNLRQQFATLESINTDLETRVNNAEPLVEDLQDTLDDTNRARHRAMRWNKFWKTGTILFAATTGVLLLTR